MAVTRPAHADVIDLFIDPIIEPLQAALAGLTDSAAGLDSAANVPGLDLSSSGAENAVVNTVVDLLETYWASADAVDSALTEASSSAAATIPTVLHALEQGWINSPLGTRVDTALNGFWHDVGGPGIVIGNGANGVGVERWPKPMVVPVGCYSVMGAPGLPTRPVRAGRRGCRVVR